MTEFLMDLVREGRLPVGGATHLDRTGEKQCVQRRAHQRQFYVAPLAQQREGLLEIIALVAAELVLLMPRLMVLMLLL